MSPGVPDHVQELLHRCIASVRQLDLLLLLRETRDRDWSANELETALRSSATALDTDLSGLLQVGLVEVQPGPPTVWRYRAGPDDPKVEALARCYRTHRTTVVRIIASSGRSSLDQFADAFRRRKDPDG